MTCRIFGALLILFAFHAPLESVAGGMLHVYPPSVDGRLVPVARPTLPVSTALVTVSGDMLEYRLEQTFFNDNDVPVQGVYLLRLDRPVSQGSVEIHVDGVKTPYVTYGRDDLFPKLRRLTGDMRDPSLLGLLGSTVFAVEPFNMRIGRSRTIRFTCRAPISPDADHLEILLPLDGESFCRAPVGELEIRVRFKGHRTLRSTLSPTHRFSLFRETSERAILTIKKQRVKVRSHFQLLSLFGGAGLDLRVFTHRKPNRDGYFMGVVSAANALASDQAGPGKDVIFILDASGSIDHELFEKERQALMYAVECLRPRDRFNVITVRTRPALLWRRPKAATDAHVLRAVKHVASVTREGGTDLYNALLNGVTQLRSRNRQTMVILFGDGRTSIGVLDPQRIVEDTVRHNKSKARIFATAVGDRADLAILDQLAMATRGKLFRLTEHEDVSSTMAKVLARITEPQVADLGLQFEHFDPTEVAPTPVPDLFPGDTALFFGIYAKGKGPARVRIHGRTANEQVSVSSPVVLPDSNPSHAYIPSLWAMRRAAGLLEHLRLRGPEHAAREHLDTLSSRFGFAIPNLRDADLPSSLATSDMGSLLWTLKTSNVPREARPDSCREVNGRVFRHTDGRWIDTQCASPARRIRVSFLSDRYFQLLKQFPALGAYFALGPNVTVMHGSHALVVGPAPASD